MCSFSCFVLSLLSLPPKLDLRPWMTNDLGARFFLFLFFGSLAAVFFDFLFYLLAYSRIKETTAHMQAHTGGHPPPSLETALHLSLAHSKAILKTSQGCLPSTCGRPGIHSGDVARLSRARRMASLWRLQAPLLVTSPGALTW